MQVDISWLGVVLAAVSAMAVGSLWYSKFMFGKPWQKISGATDSGMKEKMGPAMATMLVISLVTAYILAHFVVYTHGYNHGTAVGDGLQTGLWAGLGLGATTIFAHGLFEPRNKKILWINAGNRLVTLTIMGAIIGAFIK